MAWLLLLLAPDFTDVALEWGLHGVPAGRAVFTELNGDGRLDVVLGQRRFFVQGENRFESAPAPEGIPEKVPLLVLFADFDNDGDQDCFTGYHCEPEKPEWLKKRDKGQVDTLYLNDGKGGWTGRPLGVPRSAVHAACALDYDRDGKLDLFLGRGYRIYGALESYADALYRGRGNGTFLDVTDGVGLRTAARVGQGTWSKPTYGVTHGDFDNDGWQDLWVCTYGRQWNHLWLSDGGKRFKDIGRATGFHGDADQSGKYPAWTKAFWKERFGHEREDEKPFRSNGNTFDCAIADYDNDGDMDCILAEITHAWAGPSSDRTSLLVNVGGRFERRDAFARNHAVERWNQGDIHCGWIDYDNDGLLDALIASSDYPDRQELKLYRQKPDHTFEAARTFDWEGAGQISVGDFDRDGDLDILCGRSLNRLPKERREKLGRSCALFRNDVGNERRWISIACVGKTANRDGIGCRIEVTTADGVTQTREIRGGLGHAGHSGPFEAHFGLGSHARASRVRVLWPDRDRSESVLSDVESNQRLVVRQ
ncbi:MAG: CRTAC1 family protein [Planctomycetota bacterium]|jgi:hypothetical protein